MSNHKGKSVWSFHNRTRAKKTMKKVEQMMGGGDEKIKDDKRNGR